LIFMLGVLPKSLTIQYFYISWLLAACVTVCNLSCGPLPQKAEPHDSANKSNEFSENGVLWAYGRVELESLASSSLLLLKRTAPDQNIDNSTNSSGTNDAADDTPSSVYELLGAQEALSLNDALDRPEHFDLAYVDYNPQLTVLTDLLALSYELDVEIQEVKDVKNEDTADLVTVYAILKKPSRSFSDGQGQKILLGQGYFQYGSGLTVLKPATDLRVSKIASGVYSGQWAMHYAPSEQDPIDACQVPLSELPGFNSSQRLNEETVCIPKPATFDLCHSNPALAGCRPKTISNPNPLKYPVITGEELEQLPALNTAVDTENNFVSSLVLRTTKTAKLTFTSATLKANEQDNAMLCQNLFNAVARTIDGQINSSCILTPAPAKIREGQLTCGLSIKFVEARTYMDKVCNITAIFGGANGETQTAQVLKP
jgi:hypothetical protein